MNNTSTEEAAVFQKALDEKIERYIREARTVWKECAPECGHCENYKNELTIVFDRKLGLIVAEFENLLDSLKVSDDCIDFYSDSLTKAIDTGYIKGYLVARLGIQAGFNPLNWQYLGEKFIEITGKMEEEEKEASHD